MKTARSRSLVMLKMYLNRKKKAVLMSVLVSTLLLLLCILSNLHINSSSHSIDEYMYDIVLDAGSSGSRIHVFVFKQSGNDLELSLEHFKRIEPGLSSFAGNASAAVDSLRPLLDVAISAVPPGRYKSTAITLKATAGLRLLPEEQQTSLLGAVDAYLNSTPFSNRGVSVISGGDEAVYGWMTLNYLLGRFHSQDKLPVVAIDMGGASTQIIFKTPAESAEWLPFRYALHLKLRESAITLYHHSYLGFGLNEARKKIRNTYDQGQMLVCLPDEDTNSKRTASASEGHPVKQNFDSCVEIVKKAMFSEEECKHPSCGVKGIPQPKIDSKGHDIYTFSYFYDLIRRIMPIDAPVSVSSIKEAAQKMCHNPKHSHNKGTLCLDLAYLYTYLRHGLKFNDETFVHVADEINSQSLSWPLGDSLSYLWRIAVIQY